MAQHAVPPPAPSSWSLALQSEIAASVLRRLPSHANHVRFAVVCRSWRTFLVRHPMPPPLLWLALLDGTLFSFPVPGAFRFPATAGYQGSCDDWLLFNRDGDGDGSGYLLLNPFSGDTMRLPSLSRVRHLVGDGSSRTMPTAPLIGVTGDRGAPPETTLRKMVTCPRNVVAAIVGDWRRGRIAVCRPGTDWWLASAHDPWRGLRDIASYDGKVCAVDGDGDLYAAALGEDAHTGEPTVTWASRVISVPACTRKAAAVRHLVVSGGRLLMVRRVLLRSGAVTKYAVSMADLASSRWVKVPNVGGDTALFVGRWSSVTRRVSRREMLGNRIPFLDHDDSLSGGRIGAYDMSDGETYPLLPPPLELKHHGGAAATWLFPREQDGALSLCNLPADAFGHVARRLPADERLSLRLVCRECDAAVQRQWPPRPPASAYLALPDGRIFMYPGHRSRRFHDCMNYGGAACGGYLLFCEDGGDGVLGLLRLTSPFTGKTRLLPSLLALQARDEPIELDGELPRRGTPWTDHDEMISVRKLVVCRDGLVAPLVGGENYSKVAVCSLESFTWSCGAHDRWRRYDDLAFCGGRLHALTSGEDLVAFDVAVDASSGGEAAISRVEMAILGCYATQHYGRDVHTERYLVTSCAGALLIVRRAFPPDEELASPPPTPPGKRVAVFRADLAASRQWVELSHLGGEALFVGRLCSGTVRAATLAGGAVVRSDQVFFVEDDSADTPVPLERWRSRPQAVAYDMRDGMVTDVVPRQGWRHLPAPPTWLFPGSSSNDEGNI